MSRIDLLKLTQYLKKINQSTITLSFKEIEELVGSELPKQAKEQPKWWWNIKSNDYAQSWISAGYNTFDISHSFVTHSISFKKIDNKERYNFILRVICEFSSKGINLTKITSVFIITLLSTLILAFNSNREYDLRLGIIIMLLILFQMGIIFTGVLFAIWKQGQIHKKNTKTLKDFRLYLFATLVVTILIAVISIAFKDYICPLVIPGEYKVKCVNFTYEGYVKNSNASGDGKLLKRNGDVIKGNFKNGEINGRGKYLYNNGDIYTGNFVSGKMHGDGVYTFVEGMCYIGTFTRGEITGTGKYKLLNKDVYTGQVLKGQRSGQGTLQISDGCRYEGEWDNDYKHGKGIMYFPNGDKYEGVWQFGFIKHGSEVLFTYNNGETKKRRMYAFSKMVGLNDNIVKIEPIDKDNESEYDEFDKYDQEHFKPEVVGGDELKAYDKKGKAVYFFQMLNTDCLNEYNEVQFFGNNEMGLGGNQYCGEFYNGTFHGFGILYIRDGNGNTNQVYKGNFIDGMRNGYGVLTSKDGDRYEGNFFNDEPSGYGIYYHRNGIIDEGNWNANWKLSGYGATTIDDVRYEGIWQGDHLTGKGSIINKNGSLIKVIWSEDGTTFKEVK